MGRSPCSEVLLRGEIIQCAPWSRLHLLSATRQSSASRPHFAPRDILLPPNRSLSPMRSTMTDAANAADTDLRYPIGRPVLSKTLTDAQRQEAIEAIAAVPAR